MPDDPSLLHPILVKIQASTAATAAGLVETNTRLAELTAQLSERIDQTNERLDQTNARMEQLIAFATNGFTAVIKAMSDGFNKMDRRLIDVEAAIDGGNKLEARIRTIEDHLGLPHGSG